MFLESFYLIVKKCLPKKNNPIVYTFLIKCSNSVVNNLIKHCFSKNAFRNTISNLLTEPVQSGQ